MGVVSTGQITLYDANEVPVAALTNEVHAVPSNADGSNPDLSGAVTTLSVLLGTTDITNLYNVSATPSSGITGSLAGRTYTVTGMTVDVGYVDFTATRSGWPTLTKRFSLAKAKAGTNAVAMTSETTPPGTYDGQIGYYNGYFYQWSAATQTWVRLTTTEPAPRYFGIYEYPNCPAVTPHRYDTYLQISKTEGYKGVYVYDGGWRKTYEGQYIAQALADIMTVTAIFADGVDGRPVPTVWAASASIPLNTIIKVADYEYYKCITAGTTGSSTPAWDKGLDITDGTAHWKYLGDKPYIYGVPSDYGVPEFQAALFRTAYIHSLRGKDVYLEGSINALGGVFRGTLRTPQIETTPMSQGTSFPTPAPTWYYDGAIWDVFSGLAEGKYAASGTFNGKSISYLYRATNTDAALAAEINYYNLTYAGSVSSNGWQETAAYTSVISGLVRAHVAIRYDFHLFGGYGYARVQVNGVTVLEVAGTSTDWQYFNSNPFWLNPGNRVSLQLSSGGNFGTYARYFRIFPTISTVGIECADGSIYVAPSEYVSPSMINDGWRNTADSITANGLTFTANRNCWAGFELLSPIQAAVPGYSWIDVDAGSVFNGKANSQIYLEPNKQLAIKHTDGSIEYVAWGGHYNATGTVKLLDYPGDVKTYGKLQITETIGTNRSATDGTIVVRHLNAGGKSSIVFPSAVNYGSDYGYIAYEDAVSTNPTSEKSRMIIGVENDPTDSNEDDILLLTSGRVGINTINPAGGKVDLVGQLYVSSMVQTEGPFDGALQIREVNRVTNTQSSRSYAPRIGFHWGDRFAASIILFNGEFQLQALAGGDNFVPCRASNFITQSTRASKKNIREFKTSARRIIEAIKIVSFNFRTETSAKKLTQKHIGFIAEDAPALVAGEAHDRMDIANCVGLLLKAVQELSADNDALKQRIARLEAKIGRKTE